MRNILNKTILNYNSAEKGQLHKGLQSLSLLAILFFLPLMGWGQTDYSGIYYIANKVWNGSNTSSPYYFYSASTPEYNWYLVPGKDPQPLPDGPGNNEDAYYSSDYNSQPGDPEKPFLTTFRTNRDANSIWILKKTGEYYYIIHSLTGKYLKYEPPYSGGNVHRKAMHLETIDGEPPTGDAGKVYQFEVTETTDGGITGYNFKPRNVTASNKYFNPAGDNWQYYYGTNARPPWSLGMVGLWSTTGGGSLWPHEDAAITLNPIIVSDFDSHSVTITMPSGYEMYDVYYTIDGNSPTSSSSHAVGSVTFTLPGESATVKAKAGRKGVVTTDYSELLVDFTPPEVPTMSISGCDNQITLSHTLPEALIYYTLDGSNPTNASYLFVNPFQADNGTVVKFIAYVGNNHSAIVTQPVAYISTEAPIIIFNYTTLKCVLDCPDNTATIYCTYTTNNTEPADPEVGNSSQIYSDPIDIPQNATFWIKAVAKNSSLNASCQEEKKVTLTNVINSLSSLESITGSSNSYIIVADINASGLTNSIASFSGTLEALVKEDGTFYSISGLTKPLFASTSNATIRNLMLDDVNITSGTNVGTLVAEANGNTRIYNVGILSGSVGGTGIVGGLVGLLDGSSRVINCFSYANITGGDLVGGIVGKNNVATTSSNLKTMVMNCVFYGDITGGTSKAPIYNGTIITNNGENDGVSNFNYFYAGASYVQDKHIDVYNCALAAEARFLQRFEFFRHLLNSNRALAAWWVTGNREDKDKIMKWVMEPSQIGTSTPYPILKTPGKYPSVVNYDAEHAVTGKPRNQGGKLGTLSVTIQMGSGGAQFGPPTGATIAISSLTLPILDKDTAHFNFNYYKVQLPYYNDVGTKNYNGNRVVTGWKIVSITGGTPGTYSTGADVTFNASGEITKTPYDFADRHCTNKDLYSVSGRVFNQGAYWDVPEGVTAITIEPYWAKAAYVADAYVDVVYDTDMETEYDVSDVGGGQIYTNGNNYPIAGENQIVYTSISNAIASTALSPDLNHTVNDYAVVLVGNYHHYGDIEANKPYTVTTIDLDKDNEPDCVFMLRFDGRKGFHPVKYDFVNLIGLGMAQKSTGGKGTYNFGIPQPKSWFEVTNTALLRVTQMEYEGNRTAAQPIILHGGVMEQWVSGQGTVSNNTIYFHVGGNVWFKEFHLGCHQDKSDKKTKHPPVSVTGGDFDAFYLTGLYATTINYDDNAECYVNGGRFGTVAGTGMEGIGNASTHANGNITWLIDNADIKEFYAGGINAARIAEGNLYTCITNSHVGRFYGGPKFGDMNSGRTVKTTANECTFGFFFGAGYGGNSYYTAAPGNFTHISDPWISNSDNRYNLDWDILVLR